MSETPDYVEALIRVRAVLEFHAARPAFLPTSIELESQARAAARAARAHEIELPVLTADLGRLTAEVLRHEPRVMIDVGVALARWVALEYGISGPGPPDAAS